MRHRDARQREPAQRVDEADAGSVVSSEACRTSIRRLAPEI